MLSRAKIRQLETQVDEFTKIKSRGGIVFLSVVNKSGLIVRHEIDHDEYARIHPGMVIEYAEGSNIRMGVITSDCWRMDCPWHGAHNSFLERAGRLQELREFCSLTPVEQMAQICSMA